MKKQTVFEWQETVIRKCCFLLDFGIVIFLSNFEEKPLQMNLNYVKLKEVENDKKITI